MHTAICSFEHRDVAERARDRLLQSGFDRRDVHLQHRGPTDSDSMGEDPRAWEGTDREIAASRDMVDKVAGFFVRMFGGERDRGDHEVYANAVDRGCTVLVVDTEDEAEAARARALLHDLQAADLNVYHRPGQQPVREIVDRPLPGSSGGVQGSYSDRSSAFDPAPERTAEAARERAVASSASVDKAQAPSAGRDWTESPGAEADRERAKADSRRAEDDAVGLRYADKGYADKDKPE
ncbi:hypothetical protein EZ313_23030 [Ramlibacter henchirensis]|uniref:Uncharacterized protein n=1 Tax=Ramlibacter henchirensis TaxID=204072 RepID=A0A4Z0BMX8_9BURK|nr:hypothetical protein [Ramlibacter henchirensis]TFY99424.1 hypothetical protein EZ313_23030 [Ramlibacter henchirensis]